MNIFKFNHNFKKLLQLLLIVKDENFTLLGLQRLNKLTVI